MKSKFLLLGLFLFAGTTLTFGATNDKKSEPTKVLTEKTAKVSTSKKEEVVKNSCTVTLKFKGGEITVTSSCECSQTQACDAAYKAARLVTML